MEYLTQYLNPELLVLVPALYFIGVGFKRSESVPDKHIPALLGLCGMALAAVYVIATGELASWRDALLAVFTGITQGVLCAGATVYVNQIVKQAGKKDE